MKRVLAVLALASLGLMAAPPTTTNPDSPVAKDVQKKSKRVKGKKTPVKESTEKPVETPTKK